MQRFACREAATIRNSKACCGSAGFRAEMNQAADLRLALCVRLVAQRTRCLLSGTGFLCFASCAREQQSQALQKVQPSKRGIGVTKKIWFLIGVHTRAPSHYTHPGHPMLQVRLLPLRLTCNGRFYLCRLQSSENDGCPLGAPRGQAGYSRNLLYPQPLSL